MHKHFLSIVFLLSLCLGCGTGEYESRIGQHHGGGAAAGGADLLGPAEDVAGTRVSIRAPLGMTLLPQGADPKRTKVPAVAFPGVQLRNYEGFVKDSGGGDIPFYCHILVAKTPAGTSFDKVKTEMAKGFGHGAQLTDFPVASPEGKETKWQMVHAASKDEFFYKSKDGKEAPQSMDDVEEGYVCEMGGYAILVGWRVPSSIVQNVGNVGLAELAKATVGAVSVKPQ